jgi:hypothetical protein
MALCQDVDDENAFWCEHADMTTESIDKRMCPDKIAVCSAFEKYLCLAQKVNVELFNDRKSRNKTPFKLDNRVRSSVVLSWTSTPRTHFR